MFFRKAKSSDRIDGSEVSSWADYSGKTTPTLLHELTRDPPSKKSSRPGSLLVDDDLEDDVQVRKNQMLILLISYICEKNIKRSKNLMCIFDETC